MSKKPKHSTLDRAAYRAMEFLKLQQECKTWIESVLDKEMANSDLYTELRSGVLLCNLMNTLFPGSIKKVHKSAFGAHQLENINFVLKNLSKMGMKDDELFEPIDLHEKKNMMKVFRCMHSFASIVSGTGRAGKWQRVKDAKWSKEEIDQWRKDYGDIDMEFTGDFGGNEEAEEEAGPEKPDDVIKAEPDDFVVDETVNTKMLGVTLDELIKAVDEVERFNDTEPQETADNTLDASIKAAQYAAQVKALANQSDDSAYSERLLKAFDAIDDANGDMVDKQNVYQDDRDDKKRQKDLFDACEELKRVARNALEEASRRPARLANPDDFDLDGEVTDADVDVSLAALIKSVRKAQDLECEPNKTSERTEDASRKAARFAKQIRTVGDQNAHSKPFQKRLYKHSDKVQAANVAMVEANNRYVRNPDDRALQKDFDDKCEELILAAQNAARDAKRRPPRELKCARASDFPVDGDVTAEDLERSLKDVIKASNKTEGFADHVPIKTGDNAEDTSRKAAKLASQVKSIGDRVEDKSLRKKILKAFANIENANQDMIDAANVYCNEPDEEPNQEELTNRCEELKRICAAAVDVSKAGLESLVEESEESEEDEALKDIDPVKDPLHFSTLKGDMSAVRDLIRQGIKVDSVNGSGWTPLYTAAYVGNLELIRFFVKQGADVNVQNNDGWCPLHAGVSQGHKEVARALVEDYNATTDVLSNDGTSPLYFAAEGGRYSITRMLLDNGADPNYGRDDGWLPIHGAVFNYHAKVTKLLIDRGANPNPVNAELKNYTPLHIAVSTKKPNLKIIQTLLAHDAVDLSAKNKNGATPLHLAAMWGHLDVIKLLIAAGADLFAANKKKRTALDVAAREGHKDVAQLLAKKMGRDVPKVETRRTVISTIQAPDAPPEPPTE